jgi:hypothetical protein
MERRKGSLERFLGRIRENAAKTTFRNPGTATFESPTQASNNARPSSPDEHGEFANPEPEASQNRKMDKRKPRRNEPKPPQSPRSGKCR